MFSNLVLLQLRNCYNCTSLPPLGQLPSLKHLFILGMDGVERVGSEFYHYGNSYSSDTIKPYFSSLQTLQFARMTNWEKWLCCGCRRGEFPRLEELDISHCPKLTGKLPKQLCSLKKLRIVGCESLVASLRAPEIRELRTEDHGKFRLKRPASGFTNLLQTSEMEISDISEWEELPPQLQRLQIRECDSIEWVLEEGMVHTSTCCLLQSLNINSCGFSRPLLETVGLPTTLKSLDIGDCTKLEFLMHGLLRSHHPFLENLSITNSSSCDSLSLSLSLSFFPRLNRLSISGFEGLEYLSVSISEEDPTSSLNLLDITRCPDIAYIELPAAVSAYYYIYGCRKLKLVTVAHTLSLSSLESLSLGDCPELLFHRDGLPSHLRQLQISSCDQLTCNQVDWGLQRLASLTKFTIRGGCQDLESFPNQSLLPSSLTSLTIENLPNLRSLDCKGLQHLASLTKLSISLCPKFQSFGEKDGLKHLTSLKELYITSCGQLQYLTKEKLPNSLSYLRIEECSLLKHRCQFEKGQDWEYIAHIPRIVIDDVLY